MIPPYDGALRSPKGLTLANSLSLPLWGVWRTVLVVTAELIPRTWQLRSGGDRRGNSAARRARKNWLLSEFGNGTICVCSYSGCLSTLSFETVEADRIIAGGSYRRANIIPACRSCNVRRLDKSIATFDNALWRRLKRRRSRLGIEFG